MATSQQAAARARRTFRQPVGKAAPKTPARPGAAAEARKELEAEHKADTSILARPQARAFSLFKTEADEAWR